MKLYSLLLLLIPIALTPITSFALDTTLYGRIYVELADEDQAGTTLDDDESISRIGVRFGEDLGNGLSAVGVFEFKLDPTSGSGISSGKQQWIGLKGNFGLINAGSINGVYKTHGSGKYDPFNGTGLQARGNAGMASGSFGANSTIRNVVGYATPSVGGKVKFKLSGQYVFEENGTSKGDDGDWMLGARLKSKGWEVIAAANHDDSESADNWKIAGKIKLNSWTLAAQYEDAENGSFDGAGQYVFAALSYKIGNITLTSTAANFNGDVNNSDAILWTLGGKYAFSKRTRLYFGYRDTDADDDSKDDNATVLGLRHDF